MGNKKLEGNKRGSGANGEKHFPLSTTTVLNMWSWKVNLSRPHSLRVWSWKVHFPRPHMKLWSSKGSAWTVIYILCHRVFYQRPTLAFYVLLMVVKSLFSSSEVLENRTIELLTVTC